jgi:hypothetical protein
VRTENFVGTGHAGAVEPGFDLPPTEHVTDVAIDLADALARCVSSGVEQPLVRATLTWSQRARLNGVFDPVPTSTLISVYADERSSALGFYLIALEQTDEISHAEHSTLAAAVAAAEDEYGVPRTAWAAAI